MTSIRHSRAGEEEDEPFGDFFGVEDK